MLATHAWPVSVNGAAARRPRKVTVGRPVSGPPECVNGAAARRPRKVVDVPTTRLARGEASMGPRPDGRGKPGHVVRWPGSILASMGPRPDGRGKNQPASAMANRGRRRQWGRGQTAAESCPGWQCRRPRAGVNGAAARRPRKVCGAGRNCPAGTSVNGAAARRPRKGNGALPALSARRRQWGRGQTAAESGREHVRRNFQLDASMGAAARRPRKGCRQGPSHVPEAASMGPRPDGRGKA